ncbi:alpha/beta fold hydrolase [Marinobacteraceae bacterium S3BR75-40.1]
MGKSARQPLVDHSRENLARVGQLYVEWVKRHAERSPHKGGTSLGERVLRLSDLLPGLEKQTARVDGHRMVYWALGSRKAPPVVLVHGFGASKENWLSMALWLKRRYRLLIPDLPGFGESDYGMDRRYDYATQAERLAGWYRDMDLAPAHWAGSSMGGGIVAALSALHPDVVVSATLMNAAGVGAPHPSAIDEGLLEGENRLVPRNYREVDRLFRLVTHKRQRIWRTVLAPVVASSMMRRNNAGHHIFHDMLTPEQSIIDLAPRISKPTYLFWGDQDAVVHASCTEVYKQLIPHARVTVLEGVGHLPMVEVPRQSARLLTDFWTQAS